MTQHERLIAAKSSAWTSLDKLGYSWDQTEKEIRIYFLSLAAASSEDLSCEFSSRSCALRADVGQHRYAQQPLATLVIACNRSRR